MPSNSKNIAELLNTDTQINNADVASNAGIVTTKISGLDAQIDNGLGRLENEIGLLNVNRLIDNGAALDDFVKGFSDAFTDETGVNTGSNVNTTYQAAPNTYAMSQVVNTSTQMGANAALWQGNTSNWTIGFSNSDGNAYGIQSSESSFGGNARTTIRTVDTISRSLVTNGGGDFLKIRANNTSGINGGIGIIHEDYASHIPGNVTGNYYAAGIFSSASGHWFNGNPDSVKGAMLWFAGGNVSTRNPRAQDTSSNVAISSGSSGTEIILGLDSSTNRLYAKLNGTLNTTLNDSWAGTSGKAIDGNFYIIAYSSGEGNNLDLDYMDLSLSFGTTGVSTFQSTAKTAVSTPSTVRLVLLGKEDQSQTLNTDTVFSISRDGGTTFSAITMTQSNNYNSSGVKIYTGTVDVSGQPSGTSIVIKQTTSASKGFTLHGYSLLYK